MTLTDVLTHTIKVGTDYLQPLPKELNGKDLVVIEIFASVWKRRNGQTYTGWVHFQH